MNAEGGYEPGEQGEQAGGGATGGLRCGGWSTLARSRQWVGYGERIARHEIVGSWEATLNHPLRAVLQTFTINGGFTATHGDHPNRSPAHGAWVRTGERGFDVQLVNLAFINGILAGKRVTRLAVTVDPSGNSYTAQFHWDDFDLDGMLLGSTEGLSCATRILAQPPG